VSASNQPPIDPGARIGHVHLKVADLDRALAFYREVLGFEAIYLRDPDGNGVELYWDRPSEQWPRDGQGNLAMVTLTLALEDLLREVMGDRAI
jgi:catechol-2,3-dioxygenase